MSLRAVTEVFIVFARLGVTSFGGPIAHLGYLRNELVLRRRWLSDAQYGELVALCQFLPGPASSQVGFAMGLLRAGPLGAIAAWVAFTLPSVLLMVAIAFGALSLQGPVYAAVVAGLKAVAVAVVAHAVWGMAKTLTPDMRRIAFAVGAAALALLVPGVFGQLAAIALGIACGLLWCRELSPRPVQRLPLHVSVSAGTWALVTFVVLLVALPVFAALTHFWWIDVADAFSRAGALVFGGGHVVLPLLQAEPFIAGAVTSEQFLAGYGAAQALPGPLFAYAAYLGFLTESQFGLLAAGIAVIAIFAPGLLLIVGVMPFWERVRHRHTVRAALAGANAAIVGVLFAALCHPVFTTGITNLLTAAIALGCLALMLFARTPAWVAVVLGASTGALSALL